MAPNNAAQRQPRRYRRQWRFFRTAAAREPVRELLDAVSDRDAANIAAAMKEVRDAGRSHPDVNHLRGDIWQVEIDGVNVIYRLLFAEEGRFGQVLLALEIVNKKWQTAKARHIQLAQRRLAVWRARAHSGRAAHRNTTR